jgi:ABC-type ATPase involved in cell division
VVNRPSIILADEPTGNLDRGMTNEVMALVEELNAEGATVIFATHDESLFAHTYRRVLTIHEGRLRA